MGQWVMGHRQWPIDPWWWNNCPVACNFFVLIVDFKKLLTRSICHYHSWRLYFILRFFCIQDREGCPIPPCHARRPLLVQCAGRNDVMAIGHGSRKMTHFHLWVTGPRPLTLSVTRFCLKLFSVDLKVNILTVICVLLTLLFPTYCRHYGQWPHAKSKRQRSVYSCYWDSHLTPMGHHLPYGITQYYLPPDTSERASPCDVINGQGHI